MNRKVIAAGHICLDITPAFTHVKARTVNEILQPGHLTEVGPADVHTGGSAANTGLALKFFGIDVTLAGKIGNDIFGDMILKILEQYHADAYMSRTDRESTSYSIVVAPAGIDRMFLHNPGANDLFTHEDIPQRFVEDADLFHFGYPTQMRAMFVDNGRGLIDLLKRVHRAGAAVSLDTSVVDPLSEAGQQNWYGILEKALPYVDIFAPSIEELCFMLDRERLERWNEQAGGGDITMIPDLEKDIVPLADQCLKMGAGIVLVKCGVKGLYCSAAGKERLAGLTGKIGIDPLKWDRYSHFEEAYAADTVLSATGAGDTCVAAFLAAMLSGEEPGDAMRLAAGTGACCVEAYDALSGLKDFDNLKERIAAGWDKYSVL